MWDYYPFHPTWRRAAVRHRGLGLTGWLFLVAFTFRAIHGMLASICDSQAFLNGIRAGARQKFHCDVSHKWDDLEDTKYQHVNFIYFSILTRGCLLIFFLRDRKEGREKHWLVVFHTGLDWGSNPNPRYVPWVGIEPSPLRCMGQYFNWATLTRVPTCQL